MFCTSAGNSDPVMSMRFVFNFPFLIALCSRTTYYYHSSSSYYHQSDDHLSLAFIFLPLDSFPLGAYISLSLVLATRPLVLLCTSVQFAFCLQTSSSSSRKSCGADPPICTGPSEGAQQSFERSFFRGCCFLPSLLPWRCSFVPNRRRQGES